MDIVGVEDRGKNALRSVADISTDPAVQCLKDQEV
jgi:hypothetical protein